VKQFTVYTNPQGGYEAVEQGWSWNACGFGLFWALTKKMWALGFGVLGAFFAIWGIAAASMGMEQAYLIINVGSVVQCVIFGAYGLKWQKTHLELRGFVLKDTVTAANGKDAIELYVKQNAENQSEDTRRKPRETSSEYWRERLLAQQPKPNTASCIEMGDTVSYEFKDRRGELRKIRLAPQSIIDNCYIGHWLLGHLKGDTLQVAVPHGYRTITILSIKKGERVHSEVHEGETDSATPA
jgi:transcription elongation GreA/GreB family factor